MEELKAMPFDDRARFASSKSYISTTFLAKVLKFNFSNLIGIISPALHEKIKCTFIFCHVSKIKTPVIVGIFKIFIYDGVEGILLGKALRGNRDDFATFYL